MKIFKSLSLLLALLLCGIGGASAHGGRVGVGVYVGPGPFWGPPIYRPYYGPGPYFYPAPYFAPPPVIIQQAPPPVYIEQRPAAEEPAQEAGNYWHYCRESKAYYPYVKECPGGWQKVLPQPEK